MKMSMLIIFSLFISFITDYAQENNALFSRLQAISNNGTDFLNVDGVQITSQTIGGDFSKKNIAQEV